eukprot:snap_masked-scaffold_6-processed-gene-3.31-mRNA-1 protein AED:1.00 eAED:1.00 QI:0/-1/0/0/-1/1/1/0/130
MCTICISQQYCTQLGLKSNYGSERRNGILTMISDVCEDFIYSVAEFICPEVFMQEKIKPVVLFNLNTSDPTIFQYLNTDCCANNYSSEFEYNFTYENLKLYQFDLNTTGYSQSLFARIIRKENRTLLEVF